MANRSRHTLLNIISIIMLTFAMCSCHTNQAPSMPDPQRSIYYWRTTFQIGNEEQSFLTSHSIKRMYLHLFDVVNRAGSPQPNATIIFNTPTPPNIQIIPVIYITNDVITPDSIKSIPLADLIIKRVTQMMQTHNIQWNELQIDFDWTQRNQAAYFAMLRTMRKQLAATHRTLSTTIRLHQLALAPPPVHYGALMVYNIGRINDINEDNSILSLKNLKPYLPHLADYPLPLATALPLYSWDLAFDHDRFLGIARGINLSDTATYYHVPDSKEHGDRYIVKRYHTTDNDAIAVMQPGLTLVPGNIIRHEECPGELLSQVCDILRHERPDAMQQVIIYHLDNNNLNKYSNEQIENILGSN